MSASAPAANEATLLVLVLIVVLLLRRVLGMVRAVRFSAARLMVWAGFYTVLFALAVGSEYAFTPFELFLVYGGLVVGAAVLANAWVRDHVAFERRPPDAAWYYRLPPWIPITYVVLFLARIGLSLALLGPASLSFGPSAGPVGAGASAVLEIVDALFAVSTGLLIGRSSGVLIAHRRESARAPSAPSDGIPTAAGRLP